MKNFKIVLVVLLAIVLSVTLFGCLGEPSTDQEQSVANEEMISEANRQVGMPAIVNFTERKLQREIMELRDRADLITYLYTINLDGQFIYIGTGIGFGLPESVQFTNPQYAARVYSGTYVALPQADPTGLYMPDNLSGTWYPLINEETGDTELIRMESTMTVTQSKLPRRLIAEWSLTDNY